MKILNFGSMNLDYVYQVEHFVQPGETLTAVSQKVQCGGKGLNQSIAMARAGCKVYHAGCVGQGGERLLKLLSENKADVSLIREVEQIQGNAVIQVSKTGENCILLYGGSNQAVTETQVCETLSCFEEGDILVLQNEISSIPQILEKAAKRKLRIVFNPSPFTEEIKGWELSPVEWFLVNEIEAEQMTGEREPEKVWGVIKNCFPKANLVMTLGSRGSVCYTKEGCIRQESFPVEAVDTTAAGDTFTGYFIAGLSEGRPIEECMHMAAKAASISVTRAGAADSIPVRTSL